MNSFSRFLICVATFGLCTGFAAESGRRPNIVIFLSDDMGWTQLGLNGGKEIPTPNIDRLAREGLRFTHAHSPAATCLPQVDLRLRARLSRERFIDRPSV